MKNGDRAWFATLAVLAGYVWLRDRTWWGTAEDVLPILTALPLFVWLGHPWRLRSDQPFQLGTIHLVVAAGLLVVGAVFDLCLPGAAAWCLALWAWASRRCESADLHRIRRLLPLALLAFPWVTLDLQPVGWWFRLSSAITVANLFSALDFSVTRTGVELLVQGLPISVDAACSGLKALQSLLIAGAVLTFVMKGTHRSYWINLLLLFPLAWISNTCRILAICIAAMTWGSNFAMGAFHAWGGLAVLVFMFGLCWAILRVQQVASTTSSQS
jgi:exosortase/archaeosortase family protein